jgi:hypothetical protein
MQQTELALKEDKIMKLFKIKGIGIFLSIIFIISEVSMAQSQDNSTIATQWLLDAVGDSGRVVVESVYMIYSPKTQSKGSGFLLTNGCIITNEHVVRGCQVGDLFARSSQNIIIQFKQMVVDDKRDLAALIPINSLSGGLKLGDDTSMQLGQLVSTWGYPLGYNGPAPLLSVGYLSGFKSYKPDPKSSNLVKHLVVNGAFNSGNSGGPLFLNNTNVVIGVVVNKALPLFTPFVQSAIEAFANNKSGVVFSGADDQGKPISMVESQVVAEVVKSLRDMSQVMIGEAISIGELKSFLEENKLPQP